MRSMSYPDRHQRPRPTQPDELRWIAPALLANFATSQTNAHRLASSRRTWVERLGDDILISYQHPLGLEEARAGLEQFVAASGLTVRRVFGRFLPRQNADRSTPDLLDGDPALPATTTVTEYGLNFGIDFSAGYSAGLFLDQRANRRFVHSFAPRRVLNTFAYTCSFSVVAASVGGETVSVDLSKKSLERGKQNLALNGIPAEGHSFIADDVTEVLPRLARRGERFDAIVLDPPTFSRGNGGRKFQVEDHLPELALLALEVAERNARILLSTNCTSITTRDLELIARSALKQARRSADIHREPAMPDLPMEFSARTLWLILR